MTTGVRIPARSVEDAARSVEIADDLRTATVAGRDIEADNPRELQRLLALGIYEVLHAGLPVEPTPVPWRTRDARFEQELAGWVPHRTTRASGLVRAEPEADDTRVLLEREGVRVWTPRERISAPGPLVEGARVVLDVPAARPALSPGFFLVDGSRQASGGGAVLRVYVHLVDADRAGEVWGRALEFLEERQAHYRAKVLSVRRLYPRRDGLVVYLRKGSWELAGPLADALSGAPGLGAGVSAFARPLADGVAVAWEPSDSRSGMRGLSFGQHRAGVLAQALIEHRKDGGSLADVIVDRFTEAGIDPDDPSANITAP
ncbi:T3SS effector HopA1 family protein [Streptomyces sp. NPDC048565]|uniref:T3SS effector HopA1 family protein n=1 Tax=Streptomyces sp. NPDC048565 TaxID=3155266 RepID=UPI003421AAA1